MSEFNPHLDRYIEALKQSGFQGDCETSYGARIVAATDNSIYQVVPEAILYPATGEDIRRIVAVLAQYRGSGISITPRGAGTGTNGQSLNGSVIVDTSRHLRSIIDFDESKRQICVEPGVVLDQLNAYLKPYGLFFPANVSTASRATIGGMVGTDASGKGSRIYGKTSAYIEQLDVVLADGSQYQVKAIPIDELRQRSEQSLGDRLQYEVYWAVTQHREEIDRVFPDLNRGLTGYNLKQVLGDDELFRMCYLLAGSEGTLAFTRSITLRLLPIPKFKALIVVLYDDYLKALRHVQVLQIVGELLREIVESLLLALALGVDLLDARFLFVELADIPRVQFAVAADAVHVLPDARLVLADLRGFRVKLCDRLLGVVDVRLDSSRLAKRREHLVRNLALANVILKRVEVH